MFSPTRRGRVLDLCIAVLMLAGTACGAGMPAAPVSLPVPAAAPAEPSAMRRQKAPKTPKTKKSAEAKPVSASPKAAPASPRAARPTRVDSAALERAVTKAHAHWPLAIALARRSGNPEVAEQAAVALVREAQRLRCRSRSTRRPARP